MERKKDEEKKEKKEKEEIKKLNRALHFAVMKICEQEGTFFFSQQLYDINVSISPKTRQEDDTGSNLPKKSYLHCQKLYGHI